uniref:ATP-dependent DNA helicase n=1 Tax=Tanacetum cinerariifolium TaxID=118510 RepID=A0A699IRP4_TANCI|nr:hypothetical protein [Tanacetum cinerariifolium]
MDSTRYKSQVWDILLQHQVCDTPFYPSGVTIYFLYGYAVTGNTFLGKTLDAGIRKTSVEETSIFSISAQSDMGALLKRRKLIILDEAPMENKLCFDHLGHSLRDILHKNRYKRCEQPFGNMTMVFYVDFRQFIWVIPKDMRLTVGAHTVDVTKIHEFAEWILKVGYGELGEENGKEVLIDLPDEILIHEADNLVMSIMDFTYTNILDNINDPGCSKPQTCVKSVSADNVVEKY